MHGRAGLPILLLLTTSISAEIYRTFAKVGQCPTKVLLGVAAYRAYFVCLLYVITF